MRIDEEICVRIGKTLATFGRLLKRSRNNTKLILSKIHTYRACVPSSLLYSSKTWTVYSRHERRLSIFHLRCLHRIMKMRWQDHVRWTDNTLVQERMLFGELFKGKRYEGRPLLRYKDVCKVSIKDFSTHPICWEKMADDQVLMRSTKSRGTKEF